MGFSCGIIGLPNVGKSTLFNALTKTQVPVENYPFTTIEPNRGIVPVPDKRLLKLKELLQPKKITPSTLTFIDIAGLVKGSSKGEGLGNQFLSYIRNVDAIAHVLRCFEDKNISHIQGNIDPIQDLEVIKLELCLKDIETIQRRLNKLKKIGKPKKDIEIIEEAYEWLNKGNSLRELKLNKEKFSILQELSLLTLKPIFIVANVSEEQLISNSDTTLSKLRNILSFQGYELVIICAKLENELNELSDEEQREYLTTMGIKELALEQVVNIGYKILDLVTFFTVVRDEIRAWTLKQGTEAIKAAGKIHSDFEKGFIRAEVIRYQDLIAAKSEQNAQKQGMVSIQGRDYIVKDGDIIRFRFTTH